MLEEHKQIVETMEKREKDIEIMQLLLKHKLTKKRAEYKLLIMYYKAWNAISKARLMMIGTDGNDARTFHSTHIPGDIRQASPWHERLEKQASKL